MTKRALGILTLSTFLAFGCGEAPTEQRLTTPLPTALPALTPTPSAPPPVVTSAESNADGTRYYYGDWILRGSGMYPAPVATFELGGAVIRLIIEEDSFGGSYVVVTVPAGTAPGLYTPCVATISGKGCGAFQVTQK